MAEAGGVGLHDHAGDVVDLRQAQHAGRDTANCDHMEHVIHNKDEKIGGKNSYGHDPFPPKG